MPDHFVGYTKISLTGNCTLSSTAVTSGGRRIVSLCENATGGWTVTWPANYVPSAWVVSGTTTIQTAIATTASSCSTMTFIGDITLNKWIATGLGVTGQL